MSEFLPPPVWFGFRSRQDLIVGPFSPSSNSEYVSKSVQNRRYDNWLPVVESRESGFDTQAEGSEVEYNVEEALETEKDIDSVATAKFEMFTPDEVEESAYEEFTG